MSSRRRIPVYFFGVGLIFGPALVATGVVLIGAGAAMDYKGGSAVHLGLAVGGAGLVATIVGALGLAGIGVAEGARRLRPRDDEPRSPEEKDRR